MYEYNELAVEQGRIVPTSPKPQLQELAVFVGLSFCDVLFLYWIFVSLIRTTHQLALRRQPTKLKLFKRLLYVFIGAAVVSFILAVLQMYVISLHVIFIIYKYTKLIAPQSVYYPPLFSKDTSGRRSGQSRRLMSWYSL